MNGFARRFLPILAALIGVAAGPARVQAADPLLFADGRTLCFASQESRTAGAVEAMVFFLVIGEDGRPAGMSLWDLRYRNAETDSVSLVAEVGRAGLDERNTPSLDEFLVLECDEAARQPRRRTLVDESRARRLLIVFEQLRQSVFDTDEDAAIGALDAVLASPVELQFEVVLAMLGLQSANPVSHRFHLARTAHAPERIAEVEALLSKLC